MRDYAQRDAGAVDWLIGATKRSPEGFLLLAAGFALLMRRGASSISAPGGRKHVSENRMAPVTDAARSAAEYASDVTEKVTQAASSYAASASEYAEDTVQAAQSTARHVLEDQPLAVVLVGLATGAAVAASFPATPFEKRTLGPTGASVREAVGRTGEHLKEAGARASEELISAAQERGLTRDGLKEAAREVGEAFSNTLSSAHDDSAPHKAKRSSETFSGTQRQAAPKPGTGKGGR